MICFKCHKEIEISDHVQQGLHSECFMSWFGLKSETDFQDVVLKPADSESRSIHSTNPILKIASSFYQGKFKKYAAVLNNNHYILKVKEDEFSELPATEYLSNQIANTLKLGVPPFYFIRFNNTIETFVTKNFIKRGSSENLIHIY